MASVQNVSNSKKVNQGKAEFIAKELAKAITPVKINTNSKTGKIFSSTQEIAKNKSSETKILENKAKVNTTAKNLLSKVKESLSWR